jgi:hypothetical protein
MTRINRPKISRMRPFPFFLFFYQRASITNARNNRTSGRIPKREFTLKRTRYVSHLTGAL